MGGLRIKKNTRGSAKNYITRKAALDRLQITSGTFRKLCILKGIFPREPKKKFKGQNKLYYFTKDIRFLSHDPLIWKFREIEALNKKISTAKGNNDWDKVKKLYRKRIEDRYTLNHVIKERYPTFEDALQDLDDPLSTIALFINQAGGELQSYVTDRHNFDSMNQPDRCAKIYGEWLAYCAKTNSLRKTFVSIKGIYYQAEVRGVVITWIEPHQYMQPLASSVDYNVMTTFLEFYETLMGFILFKLYNDIGIKYPPVEDVTQEVSLFSSIVNLSGSAQRQAKREGNPAEEIQAESDEDDDANEQDKEFLSERRQIEQIHEKKLDEQKKKAHLFKDLNFFLARGTPVSSLEFVITSFGGSILSNEKDTNITHYVTDRNSSMQSDQAINRNYIQPQWIYDSVNEKILLPVNQYLPTVDLPPHLCPFASSEDDTHIPDRRAELDKMVKALSIDAHDDPSAVDDFDEDDVEGIDEDDDEVLEEKYELEKQVEKGDAPELERAVRKKTSNRDQHDEDKEHYREKMLLSSAKRRTLTGIERQQEKRKLEAEILRKKAQQIKENKQKNEEKKSTDDLIDIPSTKDNKKKSNNNNNNNNKKKNKKKSTLSGDEEPQRWVLAPTELKKFKVEGH